MTQPILKIEMSTDDVFNGMILDDAVKGILDSNFLELTTVNYNADITKYVRGFSTSRGTSRELQRVEAGTAMILLDNRDSRFTPFNTSSPYFPNVVPMRRIRITGSVYSIPLVSSCVAWYDFSDIESLWQDTARTTRITTDGQIIRGVTDKSPIGNHLSEAINGPTYKTGIQNGRSIARFDGTNDVLAAADHASIELDTDSTVFIVWKETATATFRGILSKAQDGASAGSYYYYSHTGKPALDRPFIEAGVDATNAFGTTNFRIGTVRVTGTSVAHYLEGSANGTDTLAVGTATNTTMKIGSLGPAGPHFLSGDIAEMAIYNTALSSANMNLIGADLADKWGLSWTTIP